MSFEQLAPYPFPLPPVAEQRRIVAKIEELFSQLDAGVAALQRVQAALARYRAAVLHAACTGTLVPQDPADEPAAALLARILAARRVRWAADLRARGKDPARVAYAEPAAPDAAGLPALPAGWVWATLEELTSAVRVHLLWDPYAGRNTYRTGSRLCVLEISGAGA